MATLLKNWGTYYLRSGTSTPNAVGDADGTISVYLESQNYANNTSYIRIDHKAHFIKGTASTPMAYNVKSSYRANQGSAGGTYQTLQTPDPGYVTSVSTGVTEYTRTIGSTYHTVYHNADGTGQLYVNGSIEFNPLYVSPSNYYGTRTSAFNIALPTIPRYANITSYTLTEPTTLGRLTVAWSADSLCDLVQYSLNSGAWTNGQVADLTSGSFNIDGLIPNTSYNVKIRVRRKDSQLYTESSTISRTTTAQALFITPIANFTFNIGTDIPVSFSNPSGSQVDLILESPSGTWRLSRTNITSPYTLTLSEAERNILYGLAPTTNSMSVRLVLTTTGSYYDYRSGTANIVDANPLFTNFTYEDTNATTIALTGSNQKIIKGYSNLRAIVSVANKATAQKLATMSLYQLVVGTKQTTATYSAVADVNLNLNAIDNNTFSVYAIDSRNNSKLVQKSPTTYIDYFKPYFATPVPTIERTDGIGTETTLTFAGLFYNANFGSVTNNVVLTYKYKKTTDSVYTTGTTTLTPTKVGNNFSFSGIIAGDLGATGFDANFSYNIELKATDSLDNVVYNLLLGTGTPNIAIHQNGVGINMPYDETIGGSLQVVGNTNIDGAIYLNEASGVNGGRMFLAKPETGTSLIANTRIDVTDNRLRIYHDGSGYNGAFLDLTNGTHVDSSRIITSEYKGNNFDFNNFKNPGVYAFYGTNTNAPISNVNVVGLLTVYSYSTDWCIQQFQTIPLGAGGIAQVWKRFYMFGTTWSAWKEITPRQTFIGSSLAVVIPSGTTRYVGSYLATDAYAPGFVMACAGTIKNLRVYAGGVPGAGNSYYFDLFKNNVQQNISCSITGTLTNFAQDTSNQFDVSPGDRISLRCVWSASATNNVVQYSFEFYPG